MYIPIVCLWTLLWVPLSFYMGFHHVFYLWFNRCFRRGIFLDEFRKVFLKSCEKKGVVHLRHFVEPISGFVRGRFYRFALVNRTCPFRGIFPRFANFGRCESEDFGRCIFLDWFQQGSSERITSRLFWFSLPFHSRLMDFAFGKPEFNSLEFQWCILSVYSFTVSESSIS